MKEIFYFFYTRPYGTICIGTSAMLVVWTLAMLFLRGKARRIVAVTGLCMSVLLIAALTLVGRSGRNWNGITLSPFITFSYAKENREFYKAMCMNIVLFVPLGLSMPFVLPEKLRFKPLVTIGAAVLISVTVEACQYFFKIGSCEIDDVIMNTLGAALGTVSYLLVLLIKRKTDKRAG